ncbi:hypothetical protein WKI71_45320 [Streptomyces sp. MS1.AVA.1]|uniref:Uncharacterized protein n=1 Tax=Streptomyces machairae TaxID=3134109 RepID=A0ABU8UVR0_9ACTN
MEAGATGREKRREREQELLAKMVAEVADGGGEVQVHHGAAAGAWSLTGTGPARPRFPPGTQWRQEIGTVPARRRR